MAKQVKIDNAKKVKSSTKAVPERASLTTRSPKTNLFFAAILGLIYLTVFGQSAQHALLYAIAAFLFFNTVDYFILYNRLKKENK